MEKQKENLFLEKFRLFNSQENTEEINWSSSCSSDYEDKCINDRSTDNINKPRNMKRKRKKKVPTNISNLSITIFDTSRESKKEERKDKSPILGHKSLRKSASLSPILKSTLSLDKVTSPILTSKAIRLKSPILVCKTESPKPVVKEKVKKKLFNTKSDTENTINQAANRQEDQETSNLIQREQEVVESDIITCQRVISVLEENNTRNGNISNAKLDLEKKVKTFFDSHFSSENTSIASQNSISDVLTPKNSTITSEEIEIFTCKTQVASNNNNIQSSKQEISANSSESSLYNFNAKKIRYRKDGLAYRLNNLLKKQNASLSLWQHERFLAANSNFVIPKGECTVFRILNVSFKYGCHLLDAVDINDEEFVILINSCYVSDNIDAECILKVFEPFKIVQCYDNTKLVINVTKFECSKYKS